jgi:hypothetical protein
MNERDHIGTAVPKAKRLKKLNAARLVLWTREN